VAGVATRAGVAAAEPALVVSGAGLSKGGRLILDRVSVTVPRGATTAVVGSSASGKSTLLRLLNRFDEPDTGSVRFHGVDLREYDVLELRRRVGLLAQRTVLLTASVAAEVRVGRPDLSDAAVAGLLRRAGLPDLPAERGTAGLSGGEAQRLALARVLALEPEVLLLDEPTSALDAESAGAVDAVIAELVAAGLTAVVVSHDVDRVRRMADHAVVLAGGRVVDEGPPESVAYLTASVGGEA
jgi:putative ABC transport system ATP-binding protein